MILGMREPLVLYLHIIESDSCQLAKLAGMKRYAAARGWRVESVSRFASRAKMVPGLLSRIRPAGCIVEGAGRYDNLPRALFGDIPVVYVDVLDEAVCGGAPRIVLDPEEVARAAWRELSAGNPESYAVSGFVRPHEWSRSREEAFRAIVERHGATCRVISAHRGESAERYIARQRRWIAALPRGCAIFAVQSPTARNLYAAARAAGRHIPKDLTLIATVGLEKDAVSGPPEVTVIQFDFERIGYLAARMLDQWAHGRLAEGSVERMGPLYVDRRKSTSGRGRHAAFVAGALETIRRDATNGLTVAELAARYPFSRRLFDMRFREAVGRSPLEEILHVRMEKAFTLLAQTRTSIGAIPALCGFGSNNELDKLFRTRLGVSMRAWRKRNAW